MVLPRPSAAVKQGIAFAPADRRAKGAVMDMSMRENLTLPRIKSSRRPMYAISRKAEHVESEHWIERVELRPGEPERALKLFSGGNQQKIVLANGFAMSRRFSCSTSPRKASMSGPRARSTR